MKKLILVFIWLLFAIPCQARIITVDDDGPADFTNIQAAIDVSNDGDTIEVQPGTYTSAGNRDIDFNGKVITVRSIDPNDPNIVAATIIDCNGTEAEPHRAFYFHNNEDSNSILAGLTITNGYASYGGGMYNHHSSPTISKCVITNNKAGYGGGMYNESCQPTINNCLFKNNQADYTGGAVRNRNYGAPKLLQCRFFCNRAEKGGAIHNEWHGNASINNCLFVGNTAKSNGGGIYNGEASRPNLANCTLTCNQAEKYGGGIYSSYSYNRYYNNPKLTNCILWGNYDERGTDLSSQIVARTRSLNVNYCCIQDEEPNDDVIPYSSSGIGNIDDDPMFELNPDNGGDGWGIGGNDELGDTDLLIGSPCIDAGTNIPIPELLEVDLEGNLRILDGNGDGIPIVDMGVYESPIGGFLLNTRSIIIPEGSTAGFTVALAMKPKGTVEVTVNRLSGDADLRVQSGNILIFDSSNYSEPQPVVLAADEDLDNMIGTAIIKVSDSGIYPAWVKVSESENDPVPAILYVDSRAPGINTGLNWQQAYNCLQDTLGVARANDAVKVIKIGKGIYTPDRGAEVELESCTETFQLVGGVEIKGGYAGFGEADPNMRDIQIFETILSGDLRGDDQIEDFPYNAQNSENSYHVVTNTDINETVVIDGLTITGGNSNGGCKSDCSRGGGIYNNADLVLRDCMIKYNYAKYGGGGIYNQQSSLVLTNCIFNKNIGSLYDDGDGGGICNMDGNLTLNNCEFIENSADGYGSGIYNYQGSARITNCIFIKNSRDGNGSGIFNRYSEIEIYNCTFTENKGVGIANVESDQAIIVNNCSFIGNWAGIRNSHNSKILICDSTFYHNLGSGIENSYSNPFINKCDFISNSAYKGGGIYNKHSEPMINLCIFTNNYAQLYGGGIYNDRSTPKFTDCVFLGNSAKYGGCMYNYGGKYNEDSNSLMVNCTLAENFALYGNTIACGSYGNPSDLRFINCIIWDGDDLVWNSDSSTIAMTYCDVQGSWQGVGNIDVDPCFVESGFWDVNGTPDDISDDFWIEGDYHLREKSACINAGEPDYVPEPNKTDLDGKPRVMGGRIDMGAYEYILPILAWADIEPNTLNLTSKGQWITAYIWLPEDYNVADIEPNSVSLEGQIKPERLWLTEDEQVATAKFSREYFQGILDIDEVELTISGQLTDGTIFEAKDTIKVIDKGGGKLVK
ncbi:MAG: right-handed parallel beta-helix repeat-containing protein [Planctomycetota bacterium]